MQAISLISSMGDRGREWGTDWPRSDKELVLDLGLDARVLPLICKVGMGILALLTSWDCREDPTR